MDIKKNTQQLKEEMKSYLKNLAKNLEEYLLLDALAL